MLRFSVGPTLPLYQEVLGRGSTSHHTEAPEQRARLFISFFRIKFTKKKEKKKRKIKDRLYKTVQGNEADGRKGSELFRLPQLLPLF